MVTSTKNEQATRLLGTSHTLYFWMLRHIHKEDASVCIAQIRGDKSRNVKQIAQDHIARRWQGFKKINCTPTV